MPQYMLLIFADPERGPAPDTPEGQEHMQKWFTYTEGLQQAGALVSGEALQPPSHSLVSANGPSLTTRSPLRTATVVAVDGGWSGSPLTKTPALRRPSV